MLGLQQQGCFFSWWLSESYIDLRADTAFEAQWPFFGKYVGPIYGVDYIFHTYLGFLNFQFWNISIGNWETHFIFLKVMTCPSYLEFGLGWISQSIK